MRNLQMTGRFKVQKENLPLFKRVVAACIECTDKNDIHTHQYDWFSNEDETEWTVREIFKDSEAAITHMQNLGDLMDEILDISEYSPEIYGTPSSEFLNAIAGFLPKVFPYKGGVLKNER